MEETNKFQDEVRDICGKYVALVDNPAIFTQEHIQKMKNGIRERVEPLLLAQKPKVMVYGIYNSGKSTLVNAICRREVAEVADRPMTSQIAEYDEGRYILIDSPGINAPIQHEEIADNNLRGCHIILFVISSKGIFEDQINYLKMLELIKKGLPFYIVLNERGAVLPPKEKGEKLREQAEREHREELNAIKRKIIKNLIKESGDEKIGEKYDVIVLNAKRAWNGIIKQNKQLYQKSNVSTLIDRIGNVLEGRGALKQLLAPLSALEEMIDESECILLTQTIGQDFAVKRRILCKEITLFREKILTDVKMIVERQFDSLYRGRLNKSVEDIDKVWEETYREIESSYRNLMIPLNKHMRESFSDLNLNIDDRCNVNIVREEAKKHEEYGRTDSSSGSRIGNRGILNEGQQFRETSEASAKKSVSGQGSDILSSFMKIILNALKSKHKKEREEYERLIREVEGFNNETSDRVEEEIRRRQDARTEVHSTIDKMSRQYRMELSKDMDEKFDKVLSIIDSAIQIKGQRDKKISDIRTEYKNLKSRIFDLRRRIG